MELFEDDMFALSDEDLPIETPKCNPVEEHLMKQLSDVQTRIGKTTNDIKEVQVTTREILKKLQYQAQHGENVSSDSDSDLYTIDRQPVVKKRKSGIGKVNQILLVQNNWKRVLWDKWVIGVVLQNTSTQILNDPRIYVDLKGFDQVRGLSAFWSSDSSFWYRTNTIHSRKNVTATLVLDLPKFNEDSFCDAYVMVSYQVDEQQYQTPISIISLLVKDLIDNDNMIRFSDNVEQCILTVKSMSIEKTIGIQIENHPGRRKRFLEFFNQRSFEEISADVYAVKTTGSLMFCLIEILPIIKGEARFRIFSKSVSQMNIILRLLTDQFPDMTIQDNDNSIQAAMALLEELKLYVRNGSSFEQRMARIKTDLLLS